ncbi:hypothetical protein CYY_009978 [Polysphondylium violaceum]|uniref:Glycoside hydrolase family 25 protein n=1 Tax=Polysphondylium violaceum TaxID=133409 RepID=A0A8J4V2F5_9MYCE|nr:hypothetical protein CYY_009978 [Polysphondylium violaceum]
MSKIISLFLILAISVFAAINADHGVDIDAGMSGKISSSQMSCLAGQNQKLIIQIYSGGYGLNSNFASAYKAAKSAGFSQVDAYAFLCNQCHGNDPSASINQIAQYISSNGITLGNLWIDVEQCNGCWGSLSSNAQFVTACVNNAKSAGLPVGVYTSSGEWPQTVGNLNSLSSFPLWYAHYDNNPSFSDFTSFGGWSSGVMKQYQGNTQQCGVSVDLDYFGSGSSGSSTTSSSSGSSGTTSSPITGGSGTSSGPSSGSSTTSGSGSSSTPISSGSGTTSGSSSGSSTTSGSGSSSTPISTGSGTTSGSGSSSSGTTTGSGSGSSSSPISTGSGTTSGSGSSSSGTTTGSGSGSETTTFSGSGSGSGTGSSSAGTTTGSGSGSGSSTTGSGSGSGSSSSGTTSSGSASGSTSGSGSGSGSSSSSGSGSGSGSGTTTSHQ